jgi:hypothetical protein
VTRWLSLLVLFAVCPAFGQGSWLTVLGDAANPAVNTIQVDPAPVSITDAGRVLRVRVSRSADRINWDGVPYRSYESTVLFDCANRTARYLRITYYQQPAWSGEVFKSVNYSAAAPRWMQFREVEPNPNERIIAAACLSR